MPSFCYLLLSSYFSKNYTDKIGSFNNTANTVSSSINMDNIETESNGTVSSIVRACDTDVSNQNRTIQ